MSRGSLSNFIDAVRIGVGFFPVVGVAINGWVALGIQLAANFAQSKLKRSGRLEQQAAGATLNVMSNEAVLPVIYGQPRARVR